MKEETMFRIAICDDEEIFRDRIVELTNRNFQSEYEYTLDIFDDLKKLDKARNIADYDLFLLDIEIHEDNGMEYAQTIRDTNREAKIVFITSHEQYAIEGYKTQAIGYILKPIRERNLVDTLQIAFDRMKKDYKPVEIVENKRSILLNQYDILHATKEGRYTVLHMKDGDEYEVRETLKSLLKRLDTERPFTCISQSIAINVRFVKEVRSNEENGVKVHEVEMADGEVLPFSREGYKSFKSFFAGSLAASRK